MNEGDTVSAPLELTIVQRLEEEIQCLWEFLMCKPYLIQGVMEGLHRENTFKQRHES